MMTSNIEMLLGGVARACLSACPKREDIRSFRTGMEWHLRHRVSRWTGARRYRNLIKIRPAVATGAAPETLSTDPAALSIWPI